MEFRQQQKVNGNKRKKPYQPPRKRKEPVIKVYSPVAQAIEWAKAEFKQQQEANAVKAEMEKRKKKAYQDDSKHTEAVIKVFHPAAQAYELARSELRDQQKAKANQGKVFFFH